MTASTQDSGPGTPGVRPAEAGTGSGPGGSGGTPVSSPSSLSEEAKSQARAAADEARAEGDELASEARSRAERLKSGARRTVDGAKEQARSAVDEQKNQAAEQLTGFADALRSASSELDEQGQTVVSSIVRHAADGIEHVSGAVRRSNVDDMVGSVESFARRQPAIFLGTAVLAGFGIARFLKSSSERRRAGYAYDPGYRHDPARPSAYDRPADPGTPYGGTPYEGGL